MRHVDAAASGAVETVEYDMDEEDEAWLAKYNKQVCIPQTLPSGHSRTFLISCHSFSWRAMCPSLPLP